MCNDGEEKGDGGDYMLTERRKKMKVVVRSDDEFQEGFFLKPSYENK